MRHLCFPSNSLHFQIFSSSLRILKKNPSSVSERVENFHIQLGSIACRCISRVNRQSIRVHAPPGSFFQLPNFIYMRCIKICGRTYARRKSAMCEAPCGAEGQRCHRPRGTSSPFVSRGEKHTSCGKEVLYAERRAPASPRGESSLRTLPVLAQKGLSVSSYIGGWPHGVNAARCKAGVFRDSVPFRSREKEAILSPEAL